MKFYLNCSVEKKRDGILKKSGPVKQGSTSIDG
jgi:hypothetical protein